MVIGIMSVYRFQKFGWSSLEGFYTKMEDFDESLNSSIFSALPALPETFTLTDNDQSHFTLLPNGLNCFTDGTDLIKSSISKSTSCTCVIGYHGRECGIPEPVWLSCQAVNNCSDMKPRKLPRRLIHGFNINHELEFFQVRLEEVGDVLDTIIIGESNLTAGGDPSPLYLLPELKRGYMRAFHHKIIHVLIGFFPPQGLTDGWFADTFIRDYMGQEGLARIHGITSIHFVVSSTAPLVRVKYFNSNFFFFASLNRFARWRSILIARCRRDTGQECPTLFKIIWRLSGTDFADITLVGIRILLEAVRQRVTTSWRRDSNCSHIDNKDGAGSLRW